MNGVKRIISAVKGAYFVYELRTSLYILEPWEKAIFNAFLVAFLAMSAYTSSIFLPAWTCQLIHFLFGSSSPSSSSSPIATAAAAADGIHQNSHLLVDSNMFNEQ